MSGHVVHVVVCQTWPGARVIAAAGGLHGWADHAVRGLYRKVYEQQCHAMTQSNYTLQATTRSTVNGSRQLGWPNLGQSLNY
jgi:hypothetical protein